MSLNCSDDPLGHYDNAGKAMPSAELENQVVAPDTAEDTAELTNITDATDDNTVM